MLARSSFTTNLQGDGTSCCIVDWHVQMQATHASAHTKYRRKTRERWPNRHFQSTASKGDGEGDEGDGKGEVQGGRSERGVRVRAYIFALHVCCCNQRCLLSTGRRT